MLQALQESESETSDSNINRAPIPSPFVIRTILKNHGMSLNYNNIINTTITPETSFQFGENLAKNIWNSRNVINIKKDVLEAPDSLTSYVNEMPEILIKLFIGIVSTFFKMRKQVSNRKKGKSISKATTIASVSLTTNEDEKIKKK